MRPKAFPCAMFAALLFTALLLSAAAVEPTPSNWKELTEEQKEQYISRNYGDLTEGRKGAATAAPRGSGRRVQKHTQRTMRRASERTPSGWKELLESEKLDYLKRNYD